MSPWPNAFLHARSLSSTASSFPALLSRTTPSLSSASARCLTQTSATAINPASGLPVAMRDATCRADISGVVERSFITAAYGKAPFRSTGFGLATTKSATSRSSYITSSQLM